MKPDRLLVHSGGLLPSRQLFSIYNSEVWKTLVPLPMRIHSLLAKCVCIVILGTYIVYPVFAALDTMHKQAFMDRRKILYLCSGTLFKKKAIIIFK